MKLTEACQDSTVKDGLAIRGYDARNDRDNVRKTVNAWVEEVLE